MHILVLPNAFKGSLSALQTARLLTRYLSPLHAVKAYPISDGGDGFIDFFRALYPASRVIYLQAKNAFLKNKRTSFLMLPDRKTAVIETARICGLGSAKKEELDPMGASSFGVGQVILKAVRQGATQIYVGLGGVACNDGGAGMAVACGAHISDKNGNEIPLGAEPLLRAAKLELKQLKQNLKGVRLYAVADVTNPLLGPHSSAKVFGPQKGASPAQVKVLDRAMAQWARVVKRATRRDIAHTPSTAAAGALAAGLYGCFGAKLILGSEFLFRKAHLESAFDWADWVITSEGKLDAQTFYGKAPLAVLKLAKKHKKPVLFICGLLEKKALARQKYRPNQIAVLADFAPTPDACRQYPAVYLKRLCKHLFAGESACGRK